MRRHLLALAALVGCSEPATTPSPDGPETAVDAAAPDAYGGFGTLSGMCGILQQMQLTGPTPELFTDTFTFQRAYMDPADRPLLTPGGRRLAETPNAGGSSGLSEIFAYEELARCEQAALLKTETEIVYDTPGKITDLEVSVGGHKIGVSVVRAFAYPLGEPYTLALATPLIERKLRDIQASSMNVSAADRWEKQILAVLAYDTQAADIVAQVWATADAATKADTVVIVSVTEGEDLFIYTNQ
ncbi:MAG: hypothetical protein H0T46_07695 [Deltaproteobacteria bacterium]|nr:hypothetical protein [Deltaproteobacteria bacterium]